MTATVFPQKYLSNRLGDGQNRTIGTRHFRGIWEQTPDGKMLMWCGPTVGGVEIDSFDTASDLGALALCYMQAHIETLQEIEDSVA